MNRSLTAIFFFTLAVSILECRGYASCEIDRGSGFREQDFNIRFPEKVHSALSPLSLAHQASAIKSCSNDLNYLESMKSLEKSVAHVALHTASATETLKHLNIRLLNWITRIAELRLKKSMGKNLKSSDISTQVNELIKKNFGECDSFMPGCVGANPATIRDAFKNGNFRERFYLSWNNAYQLLEDEFTCADPQCACGSSVSQMLSIESSLDRDILAFCNSWKQGEAPLSRGRFGKTPNYFRRTRKEYNQSISTFHPQEMEIPLSEREKKFLSEQGKANVNGPESLILNTGMGNFQALSKEEIEEKLRKSGFPDPHNYYYKSAELFGFQLVVSISGSTDSLLNLGCILGLSKPSELEDLRLAAIAYMIPHRHHSVFEILTASKAFQGINIFPNSDYYKNLIHTPSDFEEQVEREYHKGSSLERRLPTEIYADCIGKKGSRATASSTKKN